MEMHGSSQAASHFDRVRDFVGEHLTEVLVEDGVVRVYGPDLWLDEDTLWEHLPEAGDGAGIEDACSDLYDLESGGGELIPSLGQSCELVDFLTNGGMTSTCSALRLVEIRPRWLCATWHSEDEAQRIVAAVPRAFGSIGMALMLRHLFATNGERTAMDFLRSGTPSLPSNGLIRPAFLRELMARAGAYVLGT